MKLPAIAALALAALAAPAARAYEPVSYPGSTWGNVTRDLNGFEGYGTQGFARQGVEWFKLPLGVKAATYASYLWRVRTQNRTFYDARGPALGVEFTKDFVDFGAEYVWQEFPELSQRTEAFDIYLDWYKRIDLAKLRSSPPSVLGLPVIGFPLTFWGRLSKDFNDLEGDGAQGYVSQGIEWVRLPKDVVFRTLATYRWRFRSKNRPFYNAHGPSLGVEFSRKSVDLGIEYAWKSYPELHENTRDFWVYLTWYFNWDLKGIKVRPVPTRL